MRNSARCSTPKTNKVQDESVSNNAENSNKKLKQARLPFKVISPSTPPADSITTTRTAVVGKSQDANKGTAIEDCRKRKLSYSVDDDVGIDVDIKEDDNVSKENEMTAATKKKKLSSVSNNVVSEHVSLLDDDDDNVSDSKEDVADCSVGSVATETDLKSKSPKVVVKNKRKVAGTPEASRAQKDKSGSATKLQIKLPLSTGKKKRRKSSIRLLSPKNSSAENSHSKLTHELSSDDIEVISVELNPRKRTKFGSDSDEAKKTEIKSAENQEEKTEIIALDLESEELKKSTGENELRSFFENCTKSTAIGEAKKNLRSTPTCGKPSSNLKIGIEKSSENDDERNYEISDSSDDENKKNDRKDLEESVLSDSEADGETHNLGEKSVNITADISESPKSKPINIANSVKNGKDSISSSKNLTPKQMKLMEQRRKAREEKERKLQEEKLKKQQEKEEKEIVKKREREEKEEQRRKEREEKEEQKRKEREEKDRKRLAEIEVRNEEKRKKVEAKEEELRKKEEDRKRKEQEKEEAELKKKKAAQAFTKFFVAKTPANTHPKNEEDSNRDVGSKLLAFRPFQIKGDMKLAPVCRKAFPAEKKNLLDDLIGYNSRADVGDSDDGENKENKLLQTSELYLAELRSGKISPGKWRRLSTESKDDVILIEDELERVGQEIVEDKSAYVREEMSFKFYKFHDNRRPPYYGTWRKKSSVVKPRKPFAQDMKFFDYEADSDDEWEEEEPGESLEDGSDEDREKESEDDEYEVDNEWFVPHGHLSDEELQNEDEFGMGEGNTREAQKVKLQILQQEFAQEMKKKTEKIKPRLIGCIWADINGNQPAECATILWDTFEKKAMLFVDPPLIYEPEGDRSGEPNSPSGVTNGSTEKVTDKLKPISLSDDMVKDLIRLVHGNNHAKRFLIEEYIEYVKNTEESVKNGGLSKPFKSVIRDKIEELAEWQPVNASDLNIHEMQQTADATNNKTKKKVKRRLCWVVKQEILDKMGLSSLELKNSWKYTLQPKTLSVEKKGKAGEITSESTSTSTLENTKEKKHFEISQKTKSTHGRKSKKLQNASTSTKASATVKRGIETIKSNTTATPNEKKRVPLLMSVARGEQISTPAKNKLISQFLQQNNKESVNRSSPSKPTISRNSDDATSPIVEDDDVVILD